MRTRQNPHDSLAYTKVEAPACRPGLIEGHQRIHFFLSHGTTEGASSEIADDLARTGQFVGFAFGLADKYLLAAGGRTHAGDRQRPTDLQGVRCLDALLTTL